MQVSDFADITASKPLKKLTTRKLSSGGRNNVGRMTARFRGGGHKKRYRVIDFRRTRDGIPAKVLSVEYDPNRGARIALLAYADGEKSYILAPQDLKPGDKVESGVNADIKPGNCLPIKSIPVGTTVHNIEMKIAGGGQLARGAGCSAQLMAKEGDWAQIRLPSGEVRRVHVLCRASIGTLSNPDHENMVIGKAGRYRWMGWRPHQRGISMNPVDHPHGGGEGKSGQGNPHPVSPWGWKTKGQKTRKNKRTEKFIVKRRNK
ncbi:MAG: 50S ribosomal protein L2 [Myxococcota bacterium]|nr:50S ribosomal protein L2 [Myxococcota bacterium]